MLSAAEGAPIVILNHNTPAAYFVPAETHEWLMERLDDFELAQTIRERRTEIGQAVEVNLDHL